MRSNACDGPRSPDLPRGRNDHDRHNAKSGLATPAELCDEISRADRARTGQQQPRTLHALCEQAARLIECPQCGARSGRVCRAVDGDRLGRFVRAAVEGLMVADEFATVLGGLDVFTNATIICEWWPVCGQARDRARGAGRRPAHLSSPPGTGAWGDGNRQLLEDAGRAAGVQLAPTTTATAVGPGGS